MKKTFNKLLSVALALTLVMSFATTAFAASFTDVSEKHWSYEYVEKAASNGLVKGTGNNQYTPDKSVTNAEWSQMVGNLFFGDVLPEAGPKDPWWWPALEYNMNAHFLTGTTLYRDGLITNRIPFKPELVGATINRYDMAQVIYNIANNETLHTGTVTTAGISNRIADYQKIPTNYRAAVEYCYAAGFITGVDANGTFAGTDPMTRAAAATVLCRLFDAKNGNGTVTEPEKPSTNVTAVKDMISYAPSTRTNYDYEVTVSNTYTAGKLTNGKDITEVNIAAMLNEIKAIFPDGYSWGNGTNGDHYRYEGSNPSPPGGGCNAFAGMVGDTLFGKGTKWSKSTNLYAAKPGDIILLRDETGTRHVIVVMKAEPTKTFQYVNGVREDVEDMLITYCDGNNGGKVRWGTTEITMTVLNSYPNSTLHSAY